MLEIRPTHLKPAREFVGKYHRHNIPPVGGKFAISCFEGERLCGVAICGRPTARKLDDGATLEIYRNCTDGTRNACTKLYGACVRIARDMGYKKVITYTLESENGASLRAANFTFAGSAGGIAWTGTRRTTEGTPYIVAKAGFLLQAVIMPYDVINQQFVESLQGLTQECEFSLSEKERREREARDRFTFTEPEQCSLNVDPNTGEVVEESEVADE